ncbi:MAG: hypothetical protein RR277_01470 [Rikenellaceae bacterium]
MPYLNTKPKKLLSAGEHCYSSKSVKSAPFPWKVILRHFFSDD